MFKKDKTVYADDDTESVGFLLKLRLPALTIGLVLGIGISLVTSRFEEVLASNVYVAFFIPFVVYMATAVGSQTHSIYSRDLKSGHAKFHTYLVKESILGAVLGIIFGIFSFVLVEVWLTNMELALSVGVSVGLAIATAPIIALIITELLSDLHEDPAVGTAPLATVIQDMVSIVIYGIITSMIML
jgi:magnesium transporter